MITSIIEIPINLSFSTEYENYYSLYAWNLTFLHKIASVATYPILF